jgi:ferritin-like metal-binding protein YciE
MKTNKHQVVGRIVPPLHKDGKEQPIVTPLPKNEMLAKYFHDLLKDIYWAEKHLIKELAKMAKKATSEALKQAFLDHRTETEGQVERLNKVFETIGKKPQGKKCEAMEGLSKEAEEAIEETENDTYTRDVALIVTAQKVEHYEIASYGSLAQIARTLGNIQGAELLEATLAEEKAADQSLTVLAQAGGINEQASSEEEEAAE